MTFIDELKDLIKTKRRVKDSSLKVYLNNIVKLHDKVFNNKDIKSLDFLKDKDKIMEVLKDMKLNSRKTYLASVVVALSCCDKYDKLTDFYRLEMEELARENQKILDTQKKTPREKENWVELSVLKDIVKKHLKNVKDRGILQKDTLNNKEFDLLQQYVVGSLYTDEEHPPLRLDYIMDVIPYKEYSKLSDKDKRAKNYLVVCSRNKKFFSLGEYKTSSTYGVKEIYLGKKMNSLMNTWLKYNKTGHLLLNNRKEPMSSNSLTK